MIEESRARKRRLRKKLMVDEFQVTGFSVAVSLRDSLTMEQSNDFWTRFIQEAIEGQSLIYGGLAEGYACPEGNVSATDADRHHVQSWLQRQPEVVDCKIGHLSDAYSARGPWFQVGKIRTYTPALLKKHWAKFRRAAF